MLVREKLPKKNIESVKANLETHQMGISEQGYGLILDRLIDLYTDPITSAVREVISNAQDTTINAKSNKPIEIRLYKLDKKFSVKDYGTGMTKEELIQVYAQFGASTKTEDLDSIGAYGLGAKAPLAYTTMFMVKTIKDGKLVEAMCTRDDTGINISIIQEKETTEPNGTTVEFAIKTAEDVMNVDEILRTYKLLEEASTVKLDINIDSKPEKLIKLTTLNVDATVPVEIYLTKNGLTNAIYNCVRNNTIRPRNLVFNVQGYPYYTNGHYSRSNLLDHLLEEKFIINIPIGVLDFTTSRDNINYNERYNNFVDKILTEIQQINLETYLKHFNELTGIQKHAVNNYYIRYNSQSYNPILEITEEQKEFQKKYLKDKTKVFSIYSPSYDNVGVQFDNKDGSIPLYVTRQRALQSKTLAGEIAFKPKEIYNSIDLIGRVLVVTECQKGKQIYRMKRYPEYHDYKFSNELYQGTDLIISTPMTKEEFEETTILKDIAFKVKYNTLTEVNKHFRVKKTTQKETQTYSTLANILVETVSFEEQKEFPNEAEFAGYNIEYFCRRHRGQVKNIKIDYGEIETVNIDTLNKSKNPLVIYDSNVYDFNIKITQFEMAREKINELENQEYNQIELLTGVEKLKKLKLETLVEVVDKPIYIFTTQTGANILGNIRSEIAQKKLLDKAIIINYNDLYGETIAKIPEKFKVLSTIYRITDGDNILESQEEYGRYTSYNNLFRKKCSKDILWSIDVELVRTLKELLKTYGFKYDKLENIKLEYKRELYRQNPVVFNMFIRHESDFTDKVLPSNKETYDKINKAIEKSYEQIYNFGMNELNFESYVDLEGEELPKAKVVTRTLDFVYRQLELNQLRKQVIEYNQKFLREILS